MANSSDVRIVVNKADLEFLADYIGRTRRSTVYLDRVALLGACSAQVERMLRGTVLFPPVPSPTQMMPTGFTADDLRTPDGTREEDYLPPPPRLQRTCSVYGRNLTAEFDEVDDADDEATEVVEPPTEYEIAAAAGASGDEPPPRRRRRTQ